ncbi:hypothetical protein JG688_00013696 [Phytophthora aleatoria]|uniref:RxLR effector protein n=1 Tax=Phytophthora aleatoria TaxID=2496075 RepID=A0A8J5ILV6_9STRA|nr:hypothetical protein JG688_00013696 [Phytophthora aleatoria]
MRFSVLVALLVATFLACCSNYASGESVEDRRLRVEGSPENVAKAAAGGLKQWRTEAALTKAVKAVQTSNGDEQAMRKAITAFAAAKEGAKVSDEGIAKLSAMMAATIEKSPKSWPRLRKFAKITLGATVGGLAIYGAYKLLFDKNSSTAAITTTTGSA